MAGIVLLDNNKRVGNKHYLSHVFQRASKTGLTPRTFIHVSQGYIYIIFPHFQPENYRGGLLELQVFPVLVIMAHTVAEIRPPLASGQYCLDSARTSKEPKLTIRDTSTSDVICTGTRYLCDFPFVSCPLCPSRKKNVLQL